VSNVKRRVVSGESWTPLLIALLAASLAVAVLLVPAPWNLRIGAVLVGGVVAALMPVRALIFFWGVLLPIWSVGTLDPILFDGLRFGLAAVLLAKSRRKEKNLFSRSASWMAVVLLSVGVVVVVVGLLRPEAQAVSTGLAMVLGIAVSWTVLTRSAEPWTLMNGFLLGAVLSAVVLILAGFGYPTVTPLDFAGYSRLSGLSPSTTLVTYQMALGVVIAWVQFERRRLRPAFAVAGVLCVSALLLSGGRGGLVALALVAVVMMRWRLVRVVPAVSALAAAALFLVYANSRGIAVNTLDRLSEQTAGGDARLLLYEGALRSIAQHPFLGSGYGEFRQTFGLLPHMALQTFFVIGGLACGVPIVVVFVVLVHRIFVVDPRSFGAEGRLGHMLVAALLATVFLEPNGPFVGAAFMSILLLGVALTSPSRPHDPQAYNGALQIHAGISRA